MTSDLQTPQITIYDPEPSRLRRLVDGEIYATAGRRPNFHGARDQQSRSAAIEQVRAGISFVEVNGDGGFFVVAG